MTPPDPAEAWIADVVERHTRGLSRAEFLKALRALSARYVERRSELGQRSPAASAGKRAAFAGFYAPLHFLTVRAIVRALQANARPIHTIIDLGAGTGAAAAAWALELRDKPAIVGVDRERWALDEARWNWQQLGLDGRARHGDLVAALRPAHARRRGAGDRPAVVLAWSANELDAAARGVVLAELLTAGSAVLVVEPLSRAAAPWWPEWADAFRKAGGRADEWKFDAPLPAALDRLSHEAGFRREGLSARSLWRPGAP